MWFLGKKKEENKCEEVEEVKEEVKELIDEDDGLDFLDEGIKEDERSESDRKTRDDRIDEVVNLVKQREEAYKNGDRIKLETLDRAIIILISLNPTLAEESVSILNSSIYGDFSEEELNEYIWIDGFKGTDINIECRGHKFEIGKASKIDGEIEICKNGFHFCSELKEVIRYYPIVNRYGEYTKNRFFKIRAKVKRRDYILSKGEYKVDYMHSAMARSSALHRYEPKIFKVKPDKLVTGEIEFVEEVDYNELKSIIESNSTLVKRIRNESDWERLKKVGDISDFDREEFEEGMNKLGFSDGVIVALYKKINSNIRTEFRLDGIREVVEYVGGLVDMGVSTDMLVFLTIEKIDEFVRIEIAKAKADEYVNRRRF